jgi:hypothetical protein
MASATTASRDESPTEENRTFAGEMLTRRLGRHRGRLVIPRCRYSEAEIRGEAD